MFKSAQLIQNASQRPYITGKTGLNSQLDYVHSQIYYKQNIVQVHKIKLHYSIQMKAKNKCLCEDMQFRICSPHRFAKVISSLDLNMVLKAVCADLLKNFCWATLPPFSYLTF